MHSARPVPRAAPRTPMPAPGIVNVLPKSAISRVGNISRKLKTTSSIHIIMFSMLGTFMLPLHDSILLPRNSICIAGRNRTNVVKYAVASSAISGLPPSHRGSGAAIASPAKERNRLNRITVVRPCRSTLRAPPKSFDPMRCATCTEKPWDAAMAKPMKIQVVVDTSPMEAAGLAPRLPTIDASMNCSSTEASWARIAGPHKSRVSLTCCPVVSACPFRIRPSNMSLLSDIHAKLRKKETDWNGNHAISPDGEAGYRRRRLGRGVQKGLRTPLRRCRTTRRSRGSCGSRYPLHQC